MSARRTSSAHGHRLESGLFRHGLVNTGPGTSEYRRIPIRAKQKPHWRDVAHLIWDPYCKAPQCDQEPQFTASYRYVTGRAGRTTIRELHYCREHAQQFAKKNGLTLPTEGPTHEHQSLAIKEEVVVPARSSGDHS